MVHEMNNELSDVVEKEEDYRKKFVQSLIMMHVFNMKGKFYEVVMGVIERIGEGKCVECY
jgi:hypothetical protein